MGNCLLLGWCCFGSLFRLKATFCITSRLIFGRSKGALEVEEVIQWSWVEFESVMLVVFCYCRLPRLDYDDTRREDI
jgi:hypothetical protein